MKKIIISIIILIILFTIVNNIRIENTKKDNSLSLDDTIFFDEPVQTKSSGEKEVLTVNGQEITIQKLYNYEISGKVVKTYTYKDYYTGNEVYNTISKKDVGIVYGDLVKSEYLDNIKFSMNGGRNLRYTYKYGEWLSKLGGKEKLMTLCTNNHLITDNSDISQLIKYINEGDYVKISGYLVNVYWDNSYLKTSTTRDDDQNGACEVIYVTGVKWYKWNRDERDENKTGTVLFVSLKQPKKLSFFNI